MKKIKHSIIFVILGIFLLSCNQDDINQGSLKVDNTNFIVEDVALDISKKLDHRVSTSQQVAVGGKVEKIKKEVKEFKSIKDENGENLLYITNYKGGGFVILSADNRLSPVLAYSENNEFRTNTNEYSSGLVEWLSATKEDVKFIRRSKTLQSEKVRKQWENITVYKLIDEPEQGDCQNEYERVGPLLSTKWYQKCGFNDFMDSLNCSTSLPCGKAYAGCVPVAMAQVMKYHNHPTNYNWANMPNTYGTPTTAYLIKDIHDAITAIFCHCGGTGVPPDYDLASVFTDKFDYSSATQGSYNKGILQQQLKFNKPVILSGNPESGSAGHTWVCDGFIRGMNCIFDDFGNLIGTSSYLYFHMNWGWEDGYENGWYAFNNFNPGNNTFNFYVKMIYNINP